jgi:hypothetical protein
LGSTPFFVDDRLSCCNFFDVNIRRLTREFGPVAVEMDQERKTLTRIS